EATAKVIRKAMRGEPTIDWLLENQDKVEHYFHPREKTLTAEGTVNAGSRRSRLPLFEMGAELQGDSASRAATCRLVVLTASASGCSPTGPCFIRSSARR